MLKIDKCIKIIHILLTIELYGAQNDQIRHSFCINFYFLSRFYKYFSNFLIEQILNSFFEILKCKNAELNHFIYAFSKI